MSGIVTFLTNHWGDILGVVALVVVLADKVAKLTPTTVDDDLVAKVEAALKSLGVIKDETPPAA